MQLRIQINVAPATRQIDCEQARFETLRAAIRAFDQFPCRETAASRESAARAYLAASDIPPSSFGAPPRLMGWRR